MTLQGTRSVNTLQAEIKLSNTAPSNFIDMTITAPAADQEPCLVFATCDYCVAEEAGCANVTKVYDTNATAMQEFTNYGSSLEYREFHLLANLGWVDFDLGCSTILLGQ